MQNLMVCTRLFPVTDETIPDPEETPAPPTAEEDDPGKGFGTGGNIASITDEAFGNGGDSDGDSGSSAGGEPNEGFGTGGDVKAPKD
jgi:hypothetical protein